jgi:hypothetical protein
MNFKLQKGIRLILPDFFALASNFPIAIPQIKLLAGSMKKDAALMPGKK